MCVWHRNRHCRGDWRLDSVRTNCQVDWSAQINTDNHRERDSPIRSLDLCHHGHLDRCISRCLVCQSDSRPAHRDALLTISQGRMATQRAPWLDLCPRPHCQLRQRRYRLHSRRASHCRHRQLDNHCESDEEEQDPVQVAQNSRNPWCRVGRLL